MDPSALTTLAGQIVAILTPLVPFFSNATDAVATKVGEDVYEQVKHLYSVIHTRFAKEADNGKSSKVLQNFAEDPEEYAPNLENKLLQILQADPNFANTLSQVYHSGPIQSIKVGQDAKFENTNFSNESDRGTQTIEAGARPNFSGTTFSIGPKKQPGK
jgi:hypothetical protein